MQMAFLLKAVQRVSLQLEGAYALAVVWEDAPESLVVARRQAPLLIGLGEGEFLCASDTPALAGFTRTIFANGRWGGGFVNASWN